MTRKFNHDADFQQLIKRRRKFIDGLDANRGEINLDIFEDFYPDRAHFVYELLQNAEDAGATEVLFTLMHDKLICEHDGRAFTLEDVKSITGLHDSTKAMAQDKIGKFGVGFKSVFVYTASPSIYSGDFAFRIIELILPEPIAPLVSIGQRTRFEFPFNSPKKPQTEAYAEVADGLNELDEKALLFLSSLQSVTWRIGRERFGELVRIQQSDFHIEILKEFDGKKTSSLHFLKFDQAVPALEKQRVAIAFLLDMLPNVHDFDTTAPLAEQMKIVSAEPGCVAVFFPAMKESSGLRFHLHAPFVPELSRASIKETKANLPLFEQLATLSAQALHHIRDMGLLTPDFLAVLPIPQDQIPLRYQGIRTAIVNEMRARPLTPTHSRGHAPVYRLLQAPAALKALLDEDDLKSLIDYKGEPPLWATGATQRNSRIDNFLVGLGIRNWDLNKFVEMLDDKASVRYRYISVPPSYTSQPDETFMRWIGRKPPEWWQQFYALLHDATDQLKEPQHLEKLQIVRLRNGAFSISANCYFEGNHAASGIPIVDSRVYSSGQSKPQQEKAKKFLVNLGVREIGAKEEVELILKDRYTENSAPPDNETYKRDLKCFVDLVKQQPASAKDFANYSIFIGADDEWRKPEEIYLDHPYKRTNLSAFYGKLGSAACCVKLHKVYKNCGITANELAAFAQDVGARTELEIKPTSCLENPKKLYLWGQLARYSDYSFSHDFHIPNIGGLLKSPDMELSRLVWNTMAKLPMTSAVLQAKHQWNRSSGERVADSQLVYQLRDAAWVPQKDGAKSKDIRFVHPKDALPELLPAGFPFDAGQPWLKAIKFGETAARRSIEALQKDVAAKSLGFEDADAVERARRFSSIPKTEQEKFLTEFESRNKPALPDRALANPDRRAKQSREQALEAPNKQSEIRARSVSVGREGVKAQAFAYLQKHYRNADGDMTCQICKGPLPFKLDDGSDFFETVELVPGFKKRHHQNYLALCPNHSAMFRHANGSRELIREMVDALDGNELNVVLAQQDMTIYLSATHLIDIKSVLDAEDELSEDESVENDDLADDE